MCNDYFIDLGTSITNVGHGVIPPSTYFILKSYACSKKNSPIIMFLSNIYRNPTDTKISENVATGVIPPHVNMFCLKTKGTVILPLDPF